MACVGGDGDEMDECAGLCDGFPGWRTKKHLSGQSASPLLLVEDKFFRLGLEAVGPWQETRCWAQWLSSGRTTASQQECDDYPAQESAKWHGRYEADEDGPDVSLTGIGATTALCLRARPLWGVGSVTTP